MNKYVYEFIGTFFLVFTVGMVVIDPGLPPGFAPIAIGVVLAVMVYTTGHISGGHLNPAVTLGVWLRGKQMLNDAVFYWVAQLLAGVVAAVAVMLLKPELPSPALVGPLDILPGLLAEFLFTFALVFVVLNVATAAATDGNSFFGFAIGFTVLAGAYAMGGVSGGVFNPAVALGGSVMNIFAWSNIWIYLLAQLLAGAAAAYVFRFAHPGE
jgi:aquaporin Z